MATPSGNPAWARTADVETYGGSSTKTNYQSQGATNPRTDVTAEEFSRLCADLAAAARACGFGGLSFTPDDVTPADPTVTSVEIMSAVTTVSYLGSTPPSGFPTVTRNGDGDYTVVFPSTPTDDYSTSQALAIKGAGASISSSSAGFPVCELVNDYTVRVRVWNVGGTALADMPVRLQVW